MENKTQLIERKANFYKDNNKQVHIKLDNGKFRNGFIKYIGIDFLIIQDFENKEWTLFFLEIFDIEDYREKEEK